MRGGQSAPLFYEVLEMKKSKPLKGTHRKPAKKAYPIPKSATFSPRKDFDGMPKHATVMGGSKRHG